MPFVGQWELILLGVVLMLLFGGSQLPALGRRLGRSAREAQETLADVDPRTSLRELERPDAAKDEARPRADD